MTIESHSDPDNLQNSFRSSDTGHWLFAWIGAIAAGGFFGLLAVDLSGMMLGAAIAGIIALPVVGTFAILTWAIGLPRRSTAVAALAGACTGLLSMAIIPLPLFFLSFPVSYFLALCFGAVGSGICSRLYSKRLRPSMESKENAANRTGRLTARDLLLRISVVLSLFIAWSLGISTVHSWFSSLSWPSQAAMVTSGYLLIPEAKQIDDLFGPAWHFTANYQDPNLVQWFSVALFSGRYELTMFASAEVDRQTGQITRVIGEPSFRLQEISSALGGGVSFAAQFEFTADDWQKVVAANGDFAVIGIPMDLNHPAPGFAEYQKQPRNGIQMKAQ